MMFMWIYLSKLVPLKRLMKIHEFGLFSISIFLSFLLIVFHTYISDSVLVYILTAIFILVLVKCRLFEQEIWNRKFGFWVSILLLFDVYMFIMVYIWNLNAIGVI